MWDDVSILLTDGHSAEALLTHILSHHDVVPINHTEILMMIYGVSLSARRLSEWGISGDIHLRTLVLRPTEAWLRVAGRSEKLQALCTCTATIVYLHLCNCAPLYLCTCCYLDFGTKVAKGKLTEYGLTVLSSNKEPQRCHNFCKPCFQLIWYRLKAKLLSKGNFKRLIFTQLITISGATFSYDRTHLARASGSLIFIRLTTIRGPAFSRLLSSHTCGFAVYHHCPTHQHHHQHQREDLSP